MGLRLFRRIKIAPGFTLNLSKRGASVSVGARGAHLTVGTHGTRETVGIPGTGLSYTAIQGRGRRRRAPDPGLALSGAPAAPASWLTRGMALLLFAVIAGLVIGIRG